MYLSRYLFIITLKILYHVDAMWQFQTPMAWHLSHGVIESFNHYTYLSRIQQALQLYPNNCVGSMQITSGNGISLHGHLGIPQEKGQDGLIISSIRGQLAKKGLTHGHKVNNFLGELSSSLKYSKLWTYLFSLHFVSGFQMTAFLS